MDKLILPPTQEGYGFTDGESVVSVKLRGGASRTRADKLNAAYLVSVSWQCNPDSYRYLRTFYRVTAASGAAPFLIDLMLEDGTMTEHTARFVANTFALTSQQGLEFVVGAQLEVTPNAASATADTSYLLLWSLYELATPTFLEQLEQLANVDFAEDLT